MGLKKSTSVGSCFAILQDLNKNLVRILSVLDLGKSNLSVISHYGFGCRNRDLFPFLTIVEHT